MKASGAESRRHCDAFFDRHSIAMSPAQYRDVLTRLGLTQVAAARLLGIGERTSRRWEQSGIHGTSETLLRLLLTGRIKPADIHYTRRHRSP
jgi:DNA-binding transcriptional regulator YiaG